MIQNWNFNENDAKLVVQEVVEFCKSYLVVNRESFCDPRMELIINDARFNSQLIYTFFYSPIL